jgi:Cdc6-like AAA superfamily ATPase
VIALDEVDALKDRDLGDLLHVLSGFPATSVICVAPTRQPLLRLPEPVRSRLSPRQVLFPRYRPEEMRVILEDVTARAVRKRKPEVLDKIIDHCFGDARRSIALLRHAVQRAEEEGAAVVDPRHLVLSNFDYYDPGVEDQLDLLSTHHRLLYDLVGLKGPIASTELELLYRDACERKALAPVSTRTVKNYLDALCARRILVREHGAGSPGWIYRVAKPRKR